MITRMWRGWTRPEDADAYEELLRDEILPAFDAREIQGYHGACVLRKEDGEETEFVTILWFSTLGDIELFAGEEHSRAVIPEKARALLSRHQDRAEHYETVIGI